MAYGQWMWVALLAGSPMVSADDVTFPGHAIEAETVAGARHVSRVLGTRYSIPGAPAQVVAKAQACLARRDSGAGVVSVDAAAGRLVAVSRMAYGDGGSRTVKGRLTLEASAGGFAIVLSHLGRLQAVAAGTEEETFAPLALGDEATWQRALAALVGVEQALVDCMFG
jgi:hypothetical protein